MAGTTHADTACPSWCTITAAHPTQRIHSGPERVVSLPANPAGQIGAPPIAVRLVQVDRYDDAAGWAEGKPEVMVGPWRLPIAHAESLSARIAAALRAASDGTPKRRKLVPWDGADKGQS